MHGWAKRNSAFPRALRLALSPFLTKADDIKVEAHHSQTCIQSPPRCSPFPIAVTIDCLSSRSSMQSLFCPTRSHNNTTTTFHPSRVTPPVVHPLHASCRGPRHRGQGPERMSCSPCLSRSSTCSTRRTSRSRKPSARRGRGGRASCGVCPRRTI